jgi:ABC-type Fe3+ transport system substrate-binding protein
MLKTRLKQGARWVALLGLGAMLAAPQPSRAQSEVIHYQGPDREQRLLEGAKKEGGTLTFYSSLPVDDSGPLIEAFQKKYGIKVSLWRGSSENLVQRIVTEARANRFEVDLVTTNGTDLEPLHREGVLQPVRSPHLDNLIQGAIPAHREWVAIFINVFVQAYNTNAVKKEELPRSFRDLLDPKWKGKLGIEAEDADWFSEVVKSLGEEEGLKLFRDLVATNGLSVRKGHTLLQNLVAAGEVPLALTIYSYGAEQLKKNGAPFDWFVLPPAIGRPNGIAVAKRTQRPHAAALFYDFLLTEGQDILAGRNYVPTRKDIETPFRSGPLKVIESASFIDHGKKWQDLYREIILSRAR